MSFIFFTLSVKNYQRSPVWHRTDWKN